MDISTYIGISCSIRALWEKTKLEHATLCQDSADDDDDDEEEVRCMEPEKEMKCEI